MTDRELLELAAKAAGYRVEWDNDAPFSDYASTYDADSDGCLTLWNPLTDDGDALRLAVKLRFNIDHNLSADSDLWVLVCDDAHRDLAWEEFDEECHRLAATRRAIVRAAAELQRQKERK